MKYLAFIALLTLLRKECHRVIRLWTQTLLPPVINMTLYFFIFGQMVGRHVGEIQGMPYAAFIAPGLVMLGMVVNAYMNASSSVFIEKFQGSFQEALVAPLSPGLIVLGVILGSVMRGLMVALVITLVGWLCVGAVVQHWFVWWIVAILNSGVFAALGLFNALYAKHFDDINVVPSFVLTPLTFLGGVFYPIARLPEFWQTVSHYNPLVYLIQSMRLSYTSGQMPVELLVIIALITLAVGMACVYRINHRLGVYVR